MARRSRSQRPPTKSDILGSPKLTLAQFMVIVEHGLRVFAVPLAIAGTFIALAWLKLFVGLYPWAHLAALVFFFAFFSHSVGRAGRLWKRVSRAAGRRRVEAISLLAHRPLDVLDDKPMTDDPDALLLWQAHVARSEFRLMGMRWPKWMLSLAEQDPYAVRHAVIILLVLGAMASWGALGGRLMEAVNPALGRMNVFTPTLDAWITPPEYTHLPPVMIATPAGIRHRGDTIEVPEGSVISAHLVGQEGSAPELLANNNSEEFTPDTHGDYQITTTLREGDTVSIRRGWEGVATWHVHITADQPPTIAFDGEPSATERKSVRLPYVANDDYGIANVTARITPRESLPGASDQPLDITLSAALDKNLKQAAFEDLTAHPWSGLPVDIQLIATDAAGHRAESAVQKFVLPEREFFQPVARALIDARRKLLQRPFDEAVRNGTANLMAGVAQHPASYRGDPVVMMALRAGAVRIVLNRGAGEVSSISDLLWESAIRIEDGGIGMAEKNLRAAQKDLADALDRNASEAEINRLIDRLHQALAQYLAQISTKVAANPNNAAPDLQALGGQKTNMLTPQDLDDMLERMRDMSATGKRADARQELQKLQQLLENLHTGAPQLSEAQKQDLQTLKTLREMQQTQKDLMDKTFQQSQSAGGHEGDDKLAREQSTLLDKLRGLLGAMKSGGDENARHAASAMENALGKLQGGKAGQALPSQGEALKALQQAGDQLASSVQQSLLMLGGSASNGGEGRDPFGRGLGAGASDDGSVKVPEKLQARRVREIMDELQRRAGDTSRPKPERDYIERLLQNF